MLCRNGSFLVAVLAFVSLTSTVPAQAKDSLKFEIYQDAAKEFRWRLKDDNGKVLATAGQGYTTKESAKNGVKLLQAEADGKLKFEIYEDKGKEYRWRAKSPNGQVVAASGSSYKDKAGVEKAIDVIKKGASTAAVEETKK